MAPYWREITLGIVGLVTLLGVMSLEPIPQDPAYHLFADERGLAGVPNFLNVASNVPFALIGLMGLSALRGARPWGAVNSWRVLFLGVSLVALGSSYYHWSPSNQTLLWDRLPMSIGFMGLFVALLSEYLDRRLERFLLVPAVLLGAASVFYWHWSDDLRLYAWVQFFPLLCVLILLCLFRGKHPHQKYLVFALGLYLLSKVTEVADGAIFSATFQQLSGHSIKHLLAAWGTYQIYVMLKRRDGASAQSEP